MDNEVINEAKKQDKERQLPNFAMEMIGHEKQFSKRNIPCIRFAPTDPVMDA